MWEEVSCSGASLVATDALGLFSGIRSVSSFEFQVEPSNFSFQLRCSRIITSNFSLPLETRNWKLPSSRPGEGTHAEVQKSQRECGCQEHPAHSASTVSVTMVFAHGSRAPDQRKHHDAVHIRYAAERDAASPVKGPHPTVLPSLAARNTQKRPALGAEIVGWHAFTFRSTLLPA